MPVKAQYNPSTLKAHYTAATNKAQMVVLTDNNDLPGDDCEHCDPGQTPKYLTVTFSGMVFCGSCCNHPTSWDFKYINNYEPNGTHLLTQSGANACLWSKIIWSGTETKQPYDSTNGTCVGERGITGGGMTVTAIAERLADGEIRVKIITTATTTEPTWFDTGDVNVSSDCANLSSTANTITTCQCLAPNGRRWRSGAVVVQEGDQR